MKPSIEILEFPSNLGLIEPGPGKEPGVRKLPAWLKQHGFYQIIDPARIHSATPPSYTMDVDRDSNIRNAQAIADYALQQATVLKQSISRKNFALVLGGDCSILIGNMIALKQSGNYALFYLDGHTDFMWPELSRTHGAAGMDLAIVSGNGPSKLTDILQLKPYISEERIWAVGNREYDEEYVATIKRSKINYYSLLHLEQEGINRCVDHFFRSLGPMRADGFWIHLDVDVLQDELMPAVDSRQPGGMTYEEINGILSRLLENKLCAGMEITILDPDLDPDGKFSREFIQQIAGTIRNSLDTRSE